MHEKYWAEAGLSCGDTRSRAAEDERQWSLYMWHVQYVMTASVWLRWQCTALPIQTKSLSKAVHALYYYSLLYASLSPLCAP